MNPPRYGCSRCGQEWPQHPCTAVACPRCQVKPGAWCRRPSGHRAMWLHVEREQAALDAGKLHRCPAAAEQTTLF